MIKHYFYNKSLPKPFIISGIIISLASVLFAQEISLQQYAPTEQCNNIRHYLQRVAGEITDQSLAEITSLEQWQQIRPQRYNEYIEMMGLIDVPMTGKRPPLNIKIVDTIQKETYRIVKLYYESLPRLYVPANLYIPNNIKQPAPAILYVCGHARNQKVHYQAHPRRFAQLGFVCLIIETIQW